jgi:hypothetical protein
MSTYVIGMVRMRYFFNQPNIIRISRVEAQWITIVNSTHETECPEFASILYTRKTLTLILTYIKNASIVTKIAKCGKKKPRTCLFWFQEDDKTKTRKPTKQFSCALYELTEIVFKRTKWELDWPALAYKCFP